MRPEDNNPINIQPRRIVVPPDRDYQSQHTAAADVARSQLSAIYDSPQTTQAVAPAKTQLTTDQPHHASQTAEAYQRTHTNQHVVQAEQWKKYHSAWQNYYQKYYEQYYTGAVKQIHGAYNEQVTKLTSDTDSSQPTVEHASKPAMSKDEAMYDLRNQVVKAVQDSAVKARKSRHFVPIAAAVLVLLMFGILQYNRVIISNVKAYVTPGDIDPQNIVVDPNADTKVTQEPLLIIPKINVNVPVIYNTKSDQASQLKAMENGVAYFGIPGANSKPGQVGNTVISGHSSNDFIDGGNYKFVFALLERLQPGDIFYLHYNGIRYTYNVTKTKVVKPTDVSSLVYDTTKPEVTLITCTPLGTALNRLLVTAEQVSPNPADATKAPDTSASDRGAVMPGNSPTIVERLFR